MRAAKADANSITITEIMYDLDGGDSGREWIEIYNSGNDDVTIIDGSGSDSWRFFDGSNHTLTLAQGSLTIASHGFAILASDAATFAGEHPDYTGTLIDTTMSLSNSEETISLSSDKGQTYFNEVSFSNEWGASGDGYALEKINPLLDNEQSNWKVSSTLVGTPGYFSSSGNSKNSAPQQTPSNSDQNTSPPTPNIDEPIGNPDKIMISELFPHPKDSNHREYIELRNKGNKATSLSGWKIGNSAKIISLDAYTLVPGEHYALLQKDTGISLDDSADRVALYDSSGNFIDSVSYESTKEEYAYAYNTKKRRFEWTIDKTPFEHNTFTLPNAPPMPIITFDKNPAAPLERVHVSGELSRDEEGDLLTYIWTMEDGTEISGSSFDYRFGSTGEHVVAMSARDGEHSVGTSTTIHILPEYDIVSQRLLQNNALAIPETSIENVSVTEIYPNPTGDDLLEWIEIYNDSNQAALLNGWNIDDDERGSSPHVLDGITIGPNEYMILKREDTKLMLNNTSDQVRLFQNDEIIQSISYDDVQEGKSFSLDDKGLWYWTDPTPGEQNKPSAVSEMAATVLPQYDSANYASDQEFVDIDLPNVRELELDTPVRVQGTVAVEPGVLGKTYFYITGSQGIQVYFAKKDWPPLALGDVVGILGTITESNGEARIKVKEKGDIVPLYNGEAPEPEPVTADEISESTEGMLVAITGELIEKKGNAWFINDGSGEIRVVFQASAQIAKPSAAPGTQLSVTGIVSHTASGYRLLPRYTSDVSIEEKESMGRVLGEVTARYQLGEPMVIPPRTSPNTILTYAIITTSGLGILFISLFIKLRRETKKRVSELEQTLTNAQKKDNA